MPAARRRRFVLVLGLFLVTSLPVPPAGASTRIELDERVQRSGEVFRELTNAPDNEIPRDLIARSRCVAVIPNVIKAAWVLGGTYGRGVLSCRTLNGEWSPPVHVMMTGGSFGFQFGASSTDVVLFFMTTNSVRSLLLSKVKLSGEASVATGPIGRETQAATDARFTAEIYSYARSRGLFAGVSLAGGYLGVQSDDTEVYYGRAYSAPAVLFEHKVTSVPKSAWSFLGSLPQPKGASVARAEAPKQPKQPAAAAYDPTDMASGSAAGAPQTDMLAGPPAPGTEAMPPAPYPSTPPPYGPPPP